MKFLIINAVNWFCEVLILLLVARAVLSWFINGPYNKAYRAYEILCNITEPIVAPCRRISMKLNTGMLDLSVFLAFILVSVVRKILIALLFIIM